MRRGIACAGNWIVDIVHSIDNWPAKSDLVRITDEVEGTGGGADLARPLDGGRPGHVHR